MSFFASFFNRNKNEKSPLSWDMHDHLLFGLDDGSNSLENSLKMAEKYVELGYSHITCTPHIISNFYDNNAINIKKQRDLLQEELNQFEIPLSIDFAAEYFIDEKFIQKLKNKEPLLTFSGNHVLIETGFLNIPKNLHEIIFELFANGYTPVFAHPDRYVYFHNNFELAEQVFSTGIKFQLNLLSFIGYYSAISKKFVEWLIEKNLYHFLSTDAHSLKHLNLLPKVWNSKAFSMIDWNRVENIKKPLL
ncbi:MAG: capsular biosynthesis protein [Bacteroidetes bacterium]|nr:capsular biosynthesis protein [Bacteroidota bacterium]